MDVELLLEEIELVLSRKSSTLLSTLIIALFDACPTYAQETAPILEPQPINDIAKSLADISAVLAKASPWYESPAWTTFFGALVGILATLGVTYLSRRWSTEDQKRASAVAILEEWIRIHGLASKAIGLLKNPATIRGPAQRDVITRYGNWLELVALMMEKEIADRDILQKADMRSIMSDFLRKYTQAAKDPDADLSITDIEQVWPHLSRLAEKQ